MKKNVAIIILSVCLAVAVLLSAVLCILCFYLPHRQARLAERVWADYLSRHEYIGYGESLNPTTDESRYPSASIRCIYSESFDLSVPDPEGNEVFSPWGNYVYDIYIYKDGSGVLCYQQWGEVKKTEEDGWTYAPICFHTSETPLTAEEVRSVLDVMETHDYEHIPTHNPDMYTGMDGDTTFLVYTSSLGDPHADWKDHMISAWCAEEGSPCYDIRKAIEELVIAHDAGPVPEKIRYDD